MEGMIRALKDQISILEDKIKINVLKVSFLCDSRFFCPARPALSPKAALQHKVNAFHLLLFGHLKKRYCCLSKIILSMT